MFGLAPFIPEDDTALNGILERLGLLKPLPSRLAQFQVAHFYLANGFAEIEPDWRGATTTTPRASNKATFSSCPLPYPLNDLFSWHR